MSDPLQRLVAAVADRYEIQRELGQGGMATVYLAEDQKHHRQVAIKVLRPELAAVLGADRFVQEIQTTAQLQHPNILPLFDSGRTGGPDAGRADDFLYYVMPYVEGESLRQKLNRETQLGIEEAVRITTEVADALDYAHRHGVVHRDIKPENILLHDGRPIVADFGIALAVSAAAGGRMTETGLSLGTPHYMSPEQATAEKHITGRSDIYSLGAVLYELLTGTPPHTGASAQQIIMRIVTEPAADVSTLRKSVPPPVAAALAIALEKLPADRWTTAREFAEALAGIRPVAAGVPPAAAMTGSGAPPGAGRRGGGMARVGFREATAWVLLAVALVITAWVSTRPKPLAPVMRLAVELPDSVEALGSGLLSVALSRDGRTMAFVGTREIGSTGRFRRSLFVRRSDDVRARELQGTEGAWSPTFSVNGDWIAFLEGSHIRKIRVTGGTPELVADGARFISWADDGRIYFTRGAEFGGGLWVVNADGGQPQTVVARDSMDPSSFADIDVLPGASRALATWVDYESHPTDSMSIAVLDLRSHRIIHDLGIAGSSPRYVPPGFLLYRSGAGVLMAVPFSAQTGHVTGPPVTLAEGVSQAGPGLDYGVGGNGTIIYRWGGGRSLPANRLTLVDSQGRRRVIRSDTVQYDEPRVSPDGRRVLVRVGGAAFDVGDLYVLELASGVLTRLTTSGRNYRATWSRDGRRIYYLTGNPYTSEVMVKPWDGSGSDSVVLQRPLIAEFAEGPAGGWSALRTYPHRDIVLVPTDSIATGKPRPFVTTPSNESNIALSPSGRLLAYQSDETGRREVYIRTVPGPGPRVQVSIDGGVEPVWSNDGTTLYFRSGTHFMAATVTQRPALAVTHRVPLFDANVSDAGDVNYAVMPDGHTFLIATPPEAPAVSHYRLAVLSHWQSLFARPRASGSRP